VWTNARRRDHRDRPEQDTFTLAVTGGTGAYAGAGGEVHVTFVSDRVAKYHVVLS
jgi:hypothetical protein